MGRISKAVSSVLVGTVILTACGEAGDETVGDAAQQVDMTTVVIDEPAAADEEPEALALRDEQADQGQADSPVEEPMEGQSAITEPASATPNVAALPPIDELDAGLAEFAVCLNDNGVDVAPFTLQDMITKAAGMPIAETRAELFGFFLDTDGTDPAFIAAVDECNGIVEAIPGLGAFLPGS